jgi:hypothetical protein
MKWDWSHGLSSELDESKCLNCSNRQICTYTHTVTVQHGNTSLGVRAPGCCSEALIL